MSIPKNNNPWEEISLHDYEEHMSLDSVRQLQAMDSIMKQQFEAYPVRTAMVLGVAGGNGLRHMDRDKYQKVYGVDINAEYLLETAKRYEELSGVLECVKLDLITECDKLPKAQLVIANLLIEYIGYEAFAKAVVRTGAEYVSCVIQINTDEKNWVSDSPYLHAFDRLDEVHHQMEETSVEDALGGIGYRRILRTSTELPNGKALVRLDFINNETAG